MSSISDSSASGILTNSYQGLKAAASSTSTNKTDVYSQLNTGLTIQTREGDVVTLSSSSLSQYSSYSYNSQGLVQTDDGTSMVSTNYREVTLTSGETFSFSVQGDLSEDELQDIESIIEGIDSVVSEVLDGDMQGAMGQAVITALDDYDSISGFSANINYTKGYSVTQETTTSTYGTTASDLRSLLGNDDDNSVESADSSDDDEQLSALKLAKELLEQMNEKLEDQDETLLEKAKKPLDSLFQHYLDKFNQKDQENDTEDDQENSTKSGVVEKMGQKLDQMISEKIQNAFGNSLNRLL